jgi:hypothetical protein
MWTKNDLIGLTEKDWLSFSVLGTDGDSRYWNTYLLSPFEREKVK